jgi:hypothetical protein
VQGLIPGKLEALRVNWIQQLSSPHRWAEMGLLRAAGFGAGFGFGAGVGLGFAATSTRGLDRVHMYSLET